MGSHEVYRHIGVEMTINKAFSLHSTLQIWSGAQEDLLLRTIAPQIFTEMAEEPQMPRQVEPNVVNVEAVDVPSVPDLEVTL